MSRADPMKQRRTFARPLVTIAIAAAPLACSSPPAKPARGDFPSGVSATWYVSPELTACTARTPDHCPPNASCNPPPPRAVQCPEPMPASGTARLIKLADESCKVLPDGCHEVACGLPAACPLPWDQHLPTLRWAVAPGDGEGCVATPEPRTHRGDALPPVPIVCPLPDRAAGVIQRATADAGCVACAQAPCDATAATAVACPSDPPPAAR
jgi:hypothetical protein